MKDEFRILAVMPTIGVQKGNLERVVASIVSLVCAC